MLGKTNEIEELRSALLEASSHATELQCNLDVTSEEHAGMSMSMSMSESNSESKSNSE